MVLIYQILAQFVFRLTFGIALSMALTSPKLVTAGFFRVHLWVLLGLNTFAALAVFSAGDMFPAPVLYITIAAAIFSYVGSVIWLYESHIPGIVALGLTCVTGLASAVCVAPTVVGALDVITGGWVLGSLMTAMFLGHWYLNHPGMKLDPLKRLLLLLAIGLALRTLVCGGGLAGHVVASESLATSWWLFLGLRWAAGIIGVAAMAILTHQTLKIPNTQSATGILYAAVILSFIGELTSQLLSSDAVYPL